MGTRGPDVDRRRARERPHNGDDINNAARDAARDALGQGRTASGAKEEAYKQRPALGRGVAARSGADADPMRWRLFRLRARVPGRPSRAGQALTLEHSAAGYGDGKSQHGPVDLASSAAPSPQGEESSQCGGSGKLGGCSDQAARSVDVDKLQVCVFARRRRQAPRIQAHAEYTVGPVDRGQAHYQLWGQQPETAKDGFVGGSTCPSEAIIGYRQSLVSGRIIRRRRGRRHRETHNWAGEAELPRAARSLALSPGARPIAVRATSSGHAPEESKLSETYSRPCDGSAPPTSPHLRSMGVAPISATDAHRAPGRKRCPVLRSHTSLRGSRAGRVAAVSLAALQPREQDSSPVVTGPVTWDPIPCAN